MGHLGCCSSLIETLLRGTQAAPTYIMMTALLYWNDSGKKIYIYDNWGGHSTVAVNSLNFFRLGKALSAKGITWPSKMIHDVRTAGQWQALWGSILVGSFLVRCPPFFVFSLRIKDFKWCEPSLSSLCFRILVVPSKIASLNPARCFFSSYFTSSLPCA